MNPIKVIIDGIYNAGVAVDQAIQDVDRLQRRIEMYQRVAGRMGLGEFRDAFGDLANTAERVLNGILGLFEDIARVIGKAAEAILGTLVSAFEEAAGAAGKLVVAAGGIELAFAGIGIHANKFKEESLGSLYALTKNKDVAEDLFNFSEKMADRSRFGREQTLQATQSLVAFRISAKQNLELVLETAAAMRRLGRPVPPETPARLLSAAQAGIFRSREAYSSGVTMDMIREQGIRMSTSGRVNPEDRPKLFEAVRGAMEKQFGGTFDIYASQLETRLTTFWNNIQRIAAAASEKLFKPIEDAFGVLNEQMTRMIQAGRLDNIIQALAVPFDMLGQAITNLAPQLPGFVDWLESIITRENVVHIISDIVTWVQMLWHEITRFVEAATQGKGFVGIWDAFKDAAYQALDFVYKTWNQFIAAINWLGEHGPEIWKEVEKWWKKIGGALEVVVGVVTVLILTIAADKILDITAKIAGLAGAFGMLLVGVIGFIAANPELAAVLATLAAIAGTLAAVFGGGEKGSGASGAGMKLVNPEAIKRAAENTKKTWEGFQKATGGVGGGDKDIDRPDTGQPAASPGRQSQAQRDMQAAFQGTQANIGGFGTGGWVEPATGTPPARHSQQVRPGQAQAQALSPEEKQWIAEADRAMKEANKKVTGARKGVADSVQGTLGWLQGVGKAAIGWMGFGADVVKGEIESDTPKKFKDLQEDFNKTMAEARKKSLGDFVDQEKKKAKKTASAIDAYIGSNDVPPPHDIARAYGQVPEQQTSPGFISQEQIETEFQEQLKLADDYYRAQEEWAKAVAEQSPREHRAVAMAQAVIPLLSDELENVLIPAMNRYAEWDENHWKYARQAASAWDRINKLNEGQLEEIQRDDERQAKDADRISRDQVKLAEARLENNPLLKLMTGEKALMPALMNRLKALTSGYEGETEVDKIQREMEKEETKTAIMHAMGVLPKKGKEFGLSVEGGLLPLFDMRRAQAVQAELDRISAEQGPPQPRLPSLHEQATVARRRHELEQALREAKRMGRGIEDLRVNLPPGPVAGSGGLSGGRFFDTESQTWVEPPGGEATYGTLGLDEQVERLQAMQMPRSPVFTPKAQVRPAGGAGGNIFQLNWNFQVPANLGPEEMADFMRQKLLDFFKDAYGPVPLTP